MYLLLYRQHRVPISRYFLCVTIVLAAENTKVKKTWLGPHQGGDALLTGAHHRPGSIKVYQSFLFEKIRYKGKKKEAHRKPLADLIISFLLTNVQQLHIKHKIKSVFSFSDGIHDPL